MKNGTRSLAQRWGWLLGPTVAFTLATASRFWFLNPSFVEVDSANFFLALTRGYDIEALHPHPPGYPIYIFMGNLVDRLLDDPLRSLASISALSSGIAAGAMYLLLFRMANRTVAVIGTFFLIVNPLAWAIGAAPLSDAPSMALAVLIALFAWRADTEDDSLLFAAILVAIAIGVRFNNIAFLSLMVVPVWFRLFSSSRPGRVELATLAGVGFVFTAIVGIWFAIMIQVGTDGVGPYLDAIRKQAEAVIAPTAISVLEPVEMLQRVLRFTSGYLFHPVWSGSTEMNPLRALLVLPWVGGFAFFLITFSARRKVDIFLGLWLVGLFATVATLHYLPRYGLPYLPAVVACSVIGPCSPFSNDPENTG